MVETTTLLGVAGTTILLAAAVIGFFMRLTYNGVIKAINKVEDKLDLRLTKDEYTKDQNEYKRDQLNIANAVSKIDAKIDKCVTKDDCLRDRSHCMDLRDVKREGDVDKVDNLIESFDSLTRCLKDFTKGVCP